MAFTLKDVEEAVDKVERKARQVVDETSIDLGGGLVMVSAVLSHTFELLKILTRDCEVLHQHLETREGLCMTLCSLVGVDAEELLEPAVEELVKIRESLPKTADGQPIYRGRKLYCYFGYSDPREGRVAHYSYSDWSREWTVIVDILEGPSTGSSSDRYAKDLYSTRGLAQAAADKAREDRLCQI